MPGYDDIVNIAGLKSAQIDKPDFPLQTEKVITKKSTTKSITKPITKSKLVTTSKRGRKTKIDKLIDFIIGKKIIAQKQFSTTVRVRKKLLHFLRLIYPSLNICQIIELLILQCLAQNKELLPDNYLEQIYPNDKEEISSLNNNTATNEK